MKLSDMLFANAMMGEGGGGGGSSDFSVAEVTITSDGLIDVNLPCCYDEGGLGEGAPALIIGGFEIPSGTTTFNVVLYKGMAEMDFPAGSTVTATGAIETGEGYAFITGDGTITIS